MDAERTSGQPGQAGQPEHDEDLQLTEREAYLRRQHDVLTAARAAVARHHLRDVRHLALSGQYSYNDVRRARREYFRAKALAPTVWQWGPQREDDESEDLPRAA